MDSWVTIILYCVWLLDKTTKFAFKLCNVSAYTYQVTIFLCSLCLSSSLFVPRGGGGFVFEVWLQPPLATLPLLFVSDFVLVSRKPRPLPLVTLCLQSGSDEGMLAAVAGLITLQ